jgi:hypothetical protein
MEMVLLLFIGVFVKFISAVIYRLFGGLRAIRFVCIAF